MSQDKFNYQRDALEPARPRSFTETEFAPTSPPITIVPQATLSPSAEVFRPRANTAPSEPLSRSLPTTVPEMLAHHHHQPLSRQGSRTPKRKDVKVAPRFFPAFSKEDVSDQGPKKRKTKYSQNPPVEQHVGWVMGNTDFPPPRRFVLTRSFDTSRGRVALLLSLECGQKDDDGFTADRRYLLLVVYPPFDVVT